MSSLKNNEVLILTILHIKKKKTNYEGLTIIVQLTILY